MIQKKEPLLVTVSGGRTSGFMAVMLNREYSHLYDIKYVFANTGQEHEQTLIFVKNIQDHFGIPIIWIEADVRGKGIGTKYKIVDFESASRNGEPFEDVIAKYGLPTKGYMHCTRELKLEPMNRLRDDLGIKKTALGIRADEPKRYNPREEILYPLVDLFPTDKKEILRWWDYQSFNLEIPEYLGNCTWCYKKSDRKLNLLAIEHPNIFEFPKRMELKYPDPSRKIFRGYRTTQDVLDNKEYDLFTPVYSGSIEDDCPEECGTVII